MNEAGLFRGLRVMSLAAGLLAAAPPVDEVVLFDFERSQDLADWTDLKTLASERPVPPTEGYVEADQRRRPFARSAATGDALHPVKLEISEAHAASGTHSLKLTFGGGRFPTVTTSRVPIESLADYHGFFAEVTASRPCVIVFRFMEAGSSREGDSDACNSRWEKAALLRAGRNSVSDDLWSPSKGASKVTAFEIGMYNPGPGESLHVDHVRVTKDPPPTATAYRNHSPHYPNEPVPFFPKLEKKMKVLGSDLEVADPGELAARFKPAWIKPDREKTVDEIEGAFKARYDELRKEHPRAVFTLLRDGPEAEVWKSAYINGHDPCSVVLAQLHNRSADPEMEVFLRRRCPLLQVDLSSIPRGSEILAARLVLSRVGEVPLEKQPWSPLKPTFFVVEPCRRPWVESEVNGLEFARDRFWNEACGMDWNGEDPDFLPLILAYGPSGLRASDWDFTQAVKYWTSGDHPNHGFVLYSVKAGRHMDYFMAASRRHPQIQKRPALLVIHVPPK